MGPPGRQLTAGVAPTARNVRRWYDRTVTRIPGHRGLRGTWRFGKACRVATWQGMRRYDRPEGDWVEVSFPPVIYEETVQQARKPRSNGL